MRPLTLGFLPLIDAAALIVAEARGLFAEEGLLVRLSREGSWATVRDKLAAGLLEGSHLLAPMAFASNLGAGSDPLPLIAPFALNLNGAAVTLSVRHAGVLGGGAAGAEGLGELVRARRRAGASELTFAVVYPYSAHNYLLRAWLSDGGVDPDRDVRLTVLPPSRLPGLLADGVIEGFCAGEPWNAAAAAAGVGVIAVRAADLLGRAPDKVLGVTEAWARANPEILAAVLRALARAAAWAADPANRPELAALLARPEYIGADAALIAEGLAHIELDPGPPEAAHGVWIAEQMKRWRQIPATADSAALAARIYRADLLQAALQDAIA